MTSKLEEHDCTKHDTQERFEEVLKVFLAERVEAANRGRSWAPVSREDRTHLEELMHLLIVLKWGEDCDGDLPVRFKTWDRTREMDDSYHQFVIPRRPEDCSGGLLRWLRLLSSNARMAADTLAREIDCLEFKKITFEPEEDDAA